MGGQGSQEIGREAEELEGVATLKPTATHQKDKVKCLKPHKQFSLMLF